MTWLLTQPANVQRADLAQAKPYVRVEYARRTMPAAQQPSRALQQPAEVRLVWVSGLPVAQQGTFMSGRPQATQLSWIARLPMPTQQAYIVRQRDGMQLAWVTRQPQGFQTARFAHQRARQAAAGGGEEGKDIRP